MKKELSKSSELRLFYEELELRRQNRKMLCACGYLKASEVAPTEEEVEEDIKRQDEIIKRRYRHG